MTLADLAAAVRDLGRPTLVLESPDLPPLDPSPYAWRWYHLADTWPADLVALLRELDLGWKYVDLYSPPGPEPQLVGTGRPGYAQIWLVGYPDGPLPLEGVLGFLGALAERGISVDVVT